MFAMVIALGLALQPVEAVAVATAAEPRVILPLKTGSANVVALNEWLDLGIRAITAYYGKFPTAGTLITVEIVPDSREIHGTTYGARRIQLRVGSEVDSARLRVDWTLTHELFHLAFPTLEDRYNWAQEGLSTYLEPLARARLGQLKPEKVWSDLVSGLPQGLPLSSDSGLNSTPTWGRTYWGGCLFWLMADLEIRERTHGKKSLDDAIRKILAEGGNGSNLWTFDRVIEVGDRETGVPVLRELHEKLASHPGTIDLEALWKRLGVKRSGDTVTLEKLAPLAQIRSAMTAAR